MNRLLPCPDLPTLRRFVIGQVSESEARILEAHVQSCARCSVSISELPGEDELVEAMRQRSPVLSDALAEPTELIDRMRQLWLRHGQRDPVAERHAARIDTAVVDNADTDGATASTQTYDFLDPPQSDHELGWLGAYCVRRVLGRGGMGVVFLAEDRRLGREVALKVLLDARYNDPHYVARFNREADSLSRLQHPNIVRVYEAGQHRGRPFLALEYVAGGSLSQLLGERIGGVDESSALVEKVARAVHYAHGKGIVHRDLKPGNILLAADDQRPLVADFGLAKRLDGDELTHSGDVLGTPGYIAPELMGGSRDSTASVDIYSLGAVLYALLVGHPPFRGESAFDTLAQARSFDPVMPRRIRPTLPHDLETICLKCLDRDPRRRYATAQDLADDLARFLRQEPILARPTSKIERLIKWARRKPALASLVTVSALSVICLVGGSLWYSAQLQATLRQVEFERGRADAGYQAARETLDRMLNRLEKLQVGEVPQLRELQRKLLDDSLNFYLNALAKADDSDPVVRRDSAVACERAASIEAMLGRWDDARGHFAQCLKLLDELPASTANGTGDIVLRAKCHNNLGVIATNQRNLREAEHEHRQTMRIYEELLQKFPKRPEFRGGLSQAALNLGAVFMVEGRWADAEPQILRARKLHAELVREFPNHAPYQSSLAHDHANLALIYQNSSRMPQAEAEQLAAEALLRPLVRRHPPGGDDALTLAAVCITRAQANVAEGRTEKALEQLGEALELTDAILRQEPRHVGARHRAYNAHGTRAQILDGLKRHADAARDWQQVVEHDTAPDAWVRRTFLAMSLARSGQAARAAQVADLLTANPDVSADGHYALACVYALTAAASPTDEQLEFVERVAHTQRCANKAIRLLQQLDERGYFQMSEHQDLLRTDDDLRVLRDHPEFQELVAQMAPEPTASRNDIQQ